ncbi:MAG: hypothetical protein ACXACF_00800 [Candidatus Hermodarchaeia archaeon]|jgi:hypothetical protein
MSSPSTLSEEQQVYQKALACVESLAQAQMDAGSFLTIIHAGNSDYLPFLHKLITHFTVTKRQVHVFDYHRRIKQVYLQTLLQQKSKKSVQEYRNLHFRVILDEDHALNELMRLQRRTPSTRKPPVLFVVDPSGLFERMRGGVKQSAQALKFQYEAAVVFAQRGYAVIVSDFGGREFHRVEAVVPTILAEPATIILQFLPRRIILS